LCGLIPDLIVPIRPLQLYADGGYQLRIRRLEGNPNYGPRQVVLSPLELAAASTVGLVSCCDILASLDCVISWPKA
jgi:hypothetical protein